MKNQKRKASILDIEVFMLKLKHKIFDKIWKFLCLVKKSFIC